MNRNEEYKVLMAELERVPPALDHTVDRALARTKRARRSRWLGIPAVSLGGVAAAFVLLVNCSLPFAMACRQVPVVRALAEAVAFDPSLKAAFENDYIQPVGQSQTREGVTLSLEYLIVDQTQLNVFYTLSFEGQTRLEADPDLLDEHGKRLSYAASWNDSNLPDEGAYKLATFHFEDGMVPESLQLRFDVRDTGIPTKDADLEGPAPAAPQNGPWPDDTPYQAPPLLTTFLFDLSIDPTLLGPGRVIPLDQWIELDGQRLYLDTLSIEPTFMEITLGEDPDNTAALAGLDCYAMDELGNQYGRPGISYGGGQKVQLESCYFSGNQHLTLYITSARWLDKDRTSFTLDLNTGVADWLPQGLEIESIERGAEHVYLSIRDDGQNVSFNAYYYDPEGGEHEWEGHTVTATDNDGDGYCESSIEYRVLRNYRWDKVRFALYSNRVTVFDQPVGVPVL